MRLRLIIALSVAALAYTIAVLTGLISGYPLSRILIIGLISLLLFGVFSWITVYIIQVFSLNHRKYSDKGHNAHQKQGAVGQAPAENKGSSNLEGNHENDDNFAPLNPPILEVKEDGGEDSR
jgi:hypothetical protein